MKCTVCGGSELVAGTFKVPFTFKGQEINFSVTGKNCPACGEVTMSLDESDRLQGKMDEFKAKVNAEFVDPSFIVSVRKKLKLTQKEAGELFGGGVNAFSRYEKGSSQPHPSTVKLLQVLDRHPELLPEIYQQVSKKKTPRKPAAVMAG